MKRGKHETFSFVALFHIQEPAVMPIGSAWCKYKVEDLQQIVTGAKTMIYMIAALKSFSKK